jgi:hypothetical protein
MPGPLSAWPRRCLMHCRCGWEQPATASSTDQQEDPLLVSQQCLMSPFPHSHLLGFVHPC